MSFDKALGRLRVTVNDNGLQMHTYGHGATIECVAGRNDGCPVVAHTVSVDELRDLRYLVDRALAAAGVMP